MTSGSRGASLGRQGSVGVSSPRVAVAVARRVRTCDHHRRRAEHVIDSVVQAKRGSLTTLHVNSQQLVNIVYSWSQPRPEEQRPLAFPRGMAICGPLSSPLP